MGAFALVTGTLHKEPEFKVSKTGKKYGTGVVRVQAGDGSQFWRLMIFGEDAQAALARLHAGDTVSCQGALQAALYEPEGGKPRLSLTMLVDVVTPLRAAKKPRPAAQDQRNDDRSGYSRSGRPNAPSEPERAADRHPMDRYSGDREDHFRDAVPF